MRCHYFTSLSQFFHFNFSHQVLATLRPIKHMAICNKYEAQCETTRMLCMLSKRPEIHSYINKFGIVTILVKDLLNTRYLLSESLPHSRHAGHNKMFNIVNKIWYLEIISLPQILSMDTTARYVSASCTFRDRILPGDRWWLTVTRTDYPWTTNCTHHSQLCDSPGLNDSSRHSPSTRVSSDRLTVRHCRDE